MKRKLRRVCIVSTEYSGLGSGGGFGVGSRLIAEGLAEKGLEVFVAMPRKEGQGLIQQVGPVTVLSYPSTLYTGLERVRQYAGIYAEINADVYHSQEPSLGTHLAQLAMPHKVHAVTFRDPRSIEDWRKQWGDRGPLGWWHDFRFLRQYDREVGRAVRDADGLFTKAWSLAEKAQRVFRLKAQVGFLPDPIKIEVGRVSKGKDPTVCFLGRWDGIKRVGLFLELARQNQNVKFICAGSSTDDVDMDARIRAEARRLRNVELPGWVTGETKAEILGQSWILANTSTKEGLPVSYLEAAADGCAILAHANTDEFATKFGYWARRGDLGDFCEGLSYLLEERRWKSLGDRARQYVLSTYEAGHAIEAHIDAYNQLLYRKDR